MHKSFKTVLLGLFLISPILLIALYMFNTARREAPGNSSNIAKLKLVTPVAIIDEITKKIEEEDIEGALQKINMELPDPNIPSSEGTPLIVFAAEKNDSEIVAALLQKGAYADKTDLNTSETALIKAVRNQNFDTLNILLTGGADPNLGTNQGLTPLGLAIDLRDESLATQLLANGATNGVNKDKLILYAFQKNPIGVGLMLAGGVPANVTDKDENTPLIIAAANGDIESAKQLLSYRANINAKNKYGMTPLLYAIKGKHKAMTEYLINNGAKINASNIYGQNALFWAAYYGDSKLTHNLLVLGANYKKTTRRGQTALQMAKALGHKSTVKALEDFIAYKNLPRDSKGNIILPKVNQNAAKVPKAGASPIDTSVGNDVIDDFKQTQESKNNKQNVNASAEMPQMPGGMDMSAITSMMGGAAGGAGGAGGNMTEMLQKMQSMGATGAGAKKPAQMPSMPANMSKTGGVNLNSGKKTVASADNKKATAGAMTSADNKPATDSQIPTDAANMTPEQLREMGVPEEEIAKITQLKQGAEQLKNFKPGQDPKEILKSFNMSQISGK